MSGSFDPVGDMDKAIAFRIANIDEGCIYPGDDIFY